MQMKSIANRSDYLYRSTGGRIPWIAHRPNTERWLPRMSFFSPHCIQPQVDILVLVFPRAGLDALHAAIPHPSSQHHTHPLTLALAPPLTAADQVSRRHPAVLEHH